MLSNDSPTGRKDESFPGTMAFSASTEPDVNHIFFKNERIYKHNIMRINYTTYDVRRAQDTINPATSHRDIMVLADDGVEHANAHHFLYARILGIYHANIVYTGAGMTDYRPRRLEFLWVRWFHLTDIPGSWAASTLDCVRFPPMASDNAFGFLDPADVIRSCHVVPRFARGERYIDGQGLSRCARDSQDWHQYYVNRCAVSTWPHHITRWSDRPNARFVDRDMVMRFHWGLGVGHIYAHGLGQVSTPSPPSPGSLGAGISEHSDSDYNMTTDTDNQTGDQPGPDQHAGSVDAKSDSDSESSHSESEDIDFSDWEDDDGGYSSEFSDDDELLGFDEMYGDDADL